MNIWKIVLIAVSLSTSGWPLRAEAQDQGCIPGAHTTLVARYCTNSWPIKDPNFRWPNLRESCDPKNVLCASMRYQPPLALPTSKCRRVKILEVLSHDHLAKIRCVGGQPNSEPDLIVNLDSLFCHPTNVSRYRSSAVVQSNISEKTGRDLVIQAEARMKAMMDAVAHDTKILVDLAMKTDQKKLARHITNAHINLGLLLDQIRNKQNLDIACKPPDGTRIVGENRIRAQRTCRLLKATYDTAKDLIKFKGLNLKNAIKNASSLSRKRNPSDILAVRMLLFHALLDEAPNLPMQLKLIRKSVETGVRDFWELHSGFVFGSRNLENNSGNGYDCTDFLSSLLETWDAEPKLLSTKMLKSIAQYLGNESGAQALSINLQNLATCFALVDLRAGESPWPGDFVISNSETMNSQHAALVKKLLSKHTILTIESAGGLINSIMTKERPLFEPVPKCSKNERRLPVRPDIYVLRLKTEKPIACPFK